MDRIHQTRGKWERWYFSADFFAPQTWWIAELEMQISTDELASLHHSDVREISDSTCVCTGKYLLSVHGYFLMFQPLLHCHHLYLFIYLLIYLPQLKYKFHEDRSELFSLTLLTPISYHYSHQHTTNSPTHTTNSPTHTTNSPTHTKWIFCSLVQLWHQWPGVSTNPTS